MAQPCKRWGVQRTGCCLPTHAVLAAAVRMGLSWPSLLVPSQGLESSCRSQRPEGLGNRDWLLAAGRPCCPVLTAPFRPGCPPLFVVRRGSSPRWATPCAVVTLPGSLCQPTGLPPLSLVQGELQHLRLTAWLVRSCALGAQPQIPWKLNPGSRVLAGLGQPAAPAAWPAPVQACLVHPQQDGRSSCHDTTRGSLHLEGLSALHHGAGGCPQGSGSRTRRPRSPAWPRAGGTACAWTPRAWSTPLAGPSTASWGMATCCEPPHPPQLLHATLTLTSSQGLLRRGCAQSLLK